MNATEIPVTGTAAYWIAQREAVALLAAYTAAAADVWPWTEFEALRQIAAHGFAARMFAAQGNDLPGMIRERQHLADEMEDDDVGEEEANSPDAPPHGEDWCRRGCQPLFGMECGMCGYDGPGVWIDKVDTVAEYCCHCNARTYQSPDGLCTLCGKDAETPDTPAPQAAACFGDCGPVSRDTRCGQCAELERHARAAVAEARQDGRDAPGLATAAALAHAALACRYSPPDAERCTGAQP